MGKLSKEEADQLAALQAKHEAPDPDDSDDVSWYERTSDGERGATMRASRARTHGPQWLRDHLADRDDDGDSGQAAGSDDGAQAAGGKDPQAGTVKRFQRTVAKG
jgi:hypothetical protein